MQTIGPMAFVIINNCCLETFQVGGKEKVSGEAALRNNVSKHLRHSNAELDSYIKWDSSSNNNRMFPFNLLKTF